LEQVDSPEIGMDEDRGSPQVIFENYLFVGFNYRMTDMQAAVGRKQLERLPDLIARRRALAARYSELRAIWKD
jgi:perosamine synthetase